MTFTATPEERQARAEQLLEDYKAAAAAAEEHMLHHWDDQEGYERLLIAVKKIGGYYHSFINHPSNQDVDIPLVEDEPKFGTKPNLFPRRGH